MATLTLKFNYFDQWDCICADGALSKLLPTNTGLQAQYWTTVHNTTKLISIDSLLQETYEMDLI